MTVASRMLEEPYRSRALPPGSPRYLSWQFAAPEARPALLCVYALLAEWRALADPLAEPSAAHLKLAWWSEEIERLARGAPLHPIGRLLASLPGAPAADYAALHAAIEATARQIAGVPLERASDLPAQAEALWGGPLLFAAQLARGRSADDEVLQGSVSSLALALYLMDAIEGYAGAARAGRVILPVDELLAAQVENADLAAAEPRLHLQSYLERLRGRAHAAFLAAQETLPGPARAPLRHLLVLAALGARHARTPVRGGARGALRDLYIAWRAARSGARRA
jgi:15-cis-phytoene synthase